MLLVLEHLGGSELGRLGARMLFFASALAQTQQGVLQATFAARLLRNGAESSLGASPRSAGGPGGLHADAEPLAPVEAEVVADPGDGHNDAGLAPARTTRRRERRLHCC